MNKPKVIEVYADNGQLSHYALVDTETGNKLWSEAPEECEAMGYPVVNNDCIHSVSKCDCSPLVACEICGEEKNLDGDFWKNKKEA